MAGLQFGTLERAEVQSALATAQAKPDQWEVYLVHIGPGQRTVAQNRFFRRLLQKFAQQSGQSVAYWHDYLVERFIGFEEVATEDGYTRKVLPSTAELSIAEFSSFLTACLALAAEFHIEL